MIRRALIAVIRAYKIYLSPLLGRNCRFLPTCSEYAMQAIELHGAAKGLLLAAWRILRCNPLGSFGFDPVPQKGKWTNPERRLTKPR